MGKYPFLAFHFWIFNFPIILSCRDNQEISVIDIALTMAEPAEVTVRKASIVIPCQADGSLEKVSFTTLTPYTS
jgi:hypothetical protein